MQTIKFILYSAICKYNLFVKTWKKISARLGYITNYWNINISKITILLIHLSIFPRITTILEDENTKSFRNDIINSFNESHYLLGMYYVSKCSNLNFVLWNLSVIALFNIWSFLFPVLLSVSLTLLRRVQTDPKKFYFLPPF